MPPHIGLLEVVTSPETHIHTSVGPQQAICLVKALLKDTLLGVFRPYSLLPLDFAFPHLLTKLFRNNMDPWKLNLQVFINKKQVFIMQVLLFPCGDLVGLRMITSLCNRACLSMGAGWH